LPWKEKVLKPGLTHGEVVELVQGRFLPLIVVGPPANEVHGRQHEDVLQLA
jgi:hypothetical protein